MKKVLFAASLALMFVGTTFAQTKDSENEVSQKELVKQRLTDDKATLKLVERNATKEAKRNAKAYKKQGWQPAMGMLSMDKQLTEVYIRRYKEGNGFPEYILGESSTVTSTSAAVAHKEALVRARVNVAGNMKAEIANLNENTDTNMRLSDGEVETVQKMVDTSQSLVQQSLGRTEIILDVVRTVNGKTEEQIIVSYDGKLAKDTLLKMFDEDSSEIKSKLQDMLE